MAKTTVRPQTPSDHAVAVLKAHVDDSGKVKAMALALGVHASTIYNWRSGERGLGPEEIVLIAAYLHMTTDQLLGAKEPPPPPPLDVSAFRDGVERVGAAGSTLVEALAVLRGLVAEAERAERESRKRGTSPR